MACQNATGIAACSKTILMVLVILFSKDSLTTQMICLSYSICVTRVLIPCSCVMDNSGPCCLLRRKPCRTRARTRARSLFLFFFFLVLGSFQSAKSQATPTRQKWLDVHMGARLIRLVLQALSREHLTTATELGL